MDSRPKLALVSEKHKQSKLDKGTNTIVSFMIISYLIVTFLTMSSVLVFICLSIIGLLRS